MRVLYITYNGLADHIGQAQILPYLLGLANKGFMITIISAEKPEKAKVCYEMISERLRSANINWHFIRYHNKPPLVSTAFDLLRIYYIAQKIIRTSNIQLIHCRCFFTTFIGLLIKRRFNIPVIFDFRDFLADRRLYSDRYKFVYRFFKRKEGWMIRNSDHIVTLTEKAKFILYQAYLQGYNKPQDEWFTVIPTCADVDLFDTRSFSDADRRIVREFLGFEAGQLILGYLGSVMQDYIPEAMFRAFQILRSLEPTAKFLFVSLTDKKEIMRYAKSCGVDENDIRVIPANRVDVPKYLAIFDLSIVFIRPDQSTAGVSPTKLAELFACNIPVLAMAGVGDLDHIIKPDINDSVLVRNLTDEALEEAITQLLTIVRSPLRHGRAASMQFSLTEGIRRYQTVYLRFLQPGQQSC